MGATRPASPLNPLSARGGYLKRVGSHWDSATSFGWLLVMFFWSLYGQQIFLRLFPPISPRRWLYAGWAFSFNVIEKASSAPDVDKSIDSARDEFLDTCRYILIQKKKTETQTKKSCVDTFLEFMQFAAMWLSLGQRKASPSSPPSLGQQKARAPVRH